MHLKMFLLYYLTHVNNVSVLYFLTPIPERLDFIGSILTSSRTAYMILWLKNYPY